MSSSAASALYKPGPIITTAMQMNLFIGRRVVIEIDLKQSMNRYGSIVS